MKADQKPDDTTTKPVATNHKSIVLPVIGIIAAIGLLLLAWWFATRPTPTQPPSGPPPPALTQVQIDAFFQSQVLPALAAYDSRNKAAVDRAVDRISNGVEQYKKGIKPFVDDITSWWTRFGVIRRLGSDLGEKWWGNAANATEVHRYVSGKFERHLFSDAKLNALVATSLKQFRDDLAASQNRLHADVKAAWQKSAHAQHELNLQKLIQQVNASVQATSSKMATDSVTVGVVSFIAGYALEEATEALVKVIIARVATYIATSAATTTATSGGATAKITAAAGGGGTVIGGPVGTAIGVAAGLVVGVIADWWMTGQLEEKLTGECNQMVAEVKASILAGSDKDAGLVQILKESVIYSYLLEQDVIGSALDGRQIPSLESYRDQVCNLLVRDAYFNLLKRSPDSHAVGFVEQLKNNSQSLSGVEAAIKKSAEYKRVTAEDTVRRLYKELLGREPDTSGMQTYRELLLAGKIAPKDVEAAIKKSPEYKRATAEDTVRRLYKELLGREPDSSGMQTYRELLLAGKMTAKDVKTAIKTSSEYRKKNAP